MKNKILIVSALAATALFTGCSSTNITQMVTALSKDPAAVHVSIMTPYGSIVYDRANPGTNAISVSATGITTKP
jgi:uncharacterized lipoprotein YajG